MRHITLPLDTVRKAVDFLEESQWTHEQVGDGERVYCRCCEKGAITNYLDKSIRTPKHKPECELLVTIAALKTSLEGVQ